MLCAKIEDIAYICILIVCYFCFAVLIFTVGDIGTSYAFEKPSSTQPAYCWNEEGDARR